MTLILVNELKGRMVAAGYNQQALARALGMAVKTLRERFAKGEFNSSEIDKLIKLLDIKDPVAIFFAEPVAKNDTTIGGAK